VKKLRLPYIVAVLPLISAGHGQHHESAAPSAISDRAAFVSTISTSPGHLELVVFPLQGEAFKIPIRSVAVPLTFAPDGKALYGPCTPSGDLASPDEPIKIAWCRIDLRTGGTTPVPGSTRELVPPRRDFIPSRGLVRLFGLTQPDGKPREISLPADGHPWLNLSLSPDNERAVATHNGRVELIDIVHSTVQPLPDELFMAAWSPDGRWLAAVEKGEYGRTILMDAESLARRKILGSSELAWSPDSHYLLGMKQHDGCGPHYRTLEAIDIETGVRATIESSKCQVNQATTGWVSSEVPAPSRQTGR
jgi:WD40 repeat protein